MKPDGTVNASFAPVAATGQRPMMLVSARSTVAPAVRRADSSVAGSCNGRDQLTSTRAEVGPTSQAAASLSGSAVRKETSLALSRLPSRPARQTVSRCQLACGIAGNLTVAAPPRDSTATEAPSIEALSLI